MYFAHFCNNFIGKDGPYTEKGSRYPKARVLLVSFSREGLCRKLCDECWLVAGVPGVVLHITRYAVLVATGSGHSPSLWGDQVRWDYHYCDVIMGAIASQITSFTIVYSTVHSGANKKIPSKLRVTGLCAGNSPLTSTWRLKFFPQNIAAIWCDLTMYSNLYANLCLLVDICIILPSMIIKSEQLQRDHDGLITISVS